MDVFKLFSAQKSNYFIFQTALKAIKEHIIDLSKHEHGHCTVITLLDSIDDTVLLNKIVIKPILEKAKELAADEWGRKVNKLISDRK